MRKKIYLLLFIWIACFSIHASNPERNVPVFPKEGFNFIIANDLGRNGYYRQKPVAQLMGEVAEKSSIEFIAAAGDVHHFEGVASVYDPLWMTNYELIYDHPELMIDWHTVLGNHEYRGSTQAVLDYTHISRRWNAPDRYYTRSIAIDEQTSCLLVFIDTTPLISKYQQDTETYPDACVQDAQQQLQWIDSVLVNSGEKWKIVIGHHPAYAETKKSKEEREEMQRKLTPILERSRTDVYFCGHIHNFQHIRPKGSRVEYVVNTSASLARPVKPIEGTQFCNPEEGFTVCNVNKDKLEFYFVNYRGEIIYQYPVSK